jgi:peroxiredoxin Q/BCP
MKHRNLLPLLTIIIISLITTTGFAQISIGDKAPVFKATDDQNKEWNAQNYIGKKVIVVFFYPAAMTGGCTKQACSYRDNQEELAALDAVTVGISGDEIQNLKYFKEAHNLNFPLLSDPEGNIANSFGVPIKDGGSIKRIVDGKEVTLTRGVTTSRWTFVIDKKGNIAHADTQVNAEKDSGLVIEKIKSL